MDRGRSARAYVKYFERDALELLSGDPGTDAWDMLRAGFAMEWEPEGDADRINLRAEAYDSEQDSTVRGDFMLGTLPQQFPGQVSVSGYHALASWRHSLGNASDVRAQVYFDHTKRAIPGTYTESRDTVSASLQHDLPERGRHDLIWGFDARTTRDDLVNTTFASFIPSSRSDDTLSAFLSDDIAFLGDRLVLTLGAKFEDNDYTGFETQPSARVAWLPGARQTVWGAVSRAVRIPSRLETDLNLLAPISAPQLGFPLLYLNVLGNPDFQSEKLTSYEAGYRFMPSDTLSLDVAVFDNYYDRLQTTEIDAVDVIPGPPQYALITGHVGNLMKGETYGGTAAVNWQLRPNWRLQLHYSRIELDVELKPGGDDGNGLRVAGNSPRHQYAARAFAELARGVSLYAGVRYVAELPGQGVPSYLALDLSTGWQITDGLRASLTVMSANDARHAEFGEGRAIERAALLRLVWQP
jgi:iron complex outermembrane receptor protein